MMPIVASVCMAVMMVCAWLGCAGSAQIETIAMRQLQVADNIPEIELNALEDLFDSTDGSDWNWHSTDSGRHWVFDANANPCADNWQGLTCTGTSPNHILSIILSAYHLNGTLPATMSNFSEMIELDVSHNSISGKIPSALGLLSALQKLSLDHNSFTGSIPQSFGSLTNVVQLHIGNNFLSGSIPDSLGDMISLQFLTINFNNISGTIPETFSQLTHMRNLELAYQSDSGPGLHGSIDPLTSMLNLTTLSLEYNSFSSTIPAALGNLINITSLDLDHNRFTGSLPSTLGKLINLISFYMDHNFLSGTIPDSFGNMSKLKDLYLYLTQLSGSIPDSFGNLSELVVIDLFSNNFSGSIPETFSQLTKLYTFIANTNRMTGTIPQFIGELPRLGKFYIGDNQFSGTVPENIGALDKLVILAVNSNGFTGTIPATLSQLRFLNTLQLNDNYFIGSIPAELCLLDHLEDMEMNNNLLEGELPRNLSAMKRLGVLRVQDNFLSGNLNGLFDPEGQTQLTSVQLNNNQFTGTLPSEVFEVTSLITFSAAINCFHGTIPITVCSAANLVSLLLDGLSSAESCRQTLIPALSKSYVPLHSMHGTIPLCMFALPHLTTLHLSGNKLTGSISSTVVISETLTDLCLSFNELVGTIPDAVQQHAWAVNLDLSSNRLTGELLKSFPRAVSTASALSLQNNRLSGEIPATVTQMKNVSILGSNLFSCSLDRHEIPTHDSSNHNSRSNYQCGSSEFEIWYYLWLSVSLVISVVALVSMTNGFIEHRTQWWLWISLCRGKKTSQKCTPIATELREDSTSTSVSYSSYHNNDNLKPTEVVLLFEELDALEKIATLCVVFIILLFVPLYCTLNMYYGTLLHSYAWTVSAAFLSGVTPFGFVAALWLALLLLFIVVYASTAERTNRSNKTKCYVNANTTDKIIDRINADIKNASPSALAALDDPTGTGTNIDTSPGVDDSTGTDTSSGVGSSDKYSAASKLKLRFQIVSILFIVVNTVVVVGVNFAYVYVAIHLSSDAQRAMQIFLSLFKLGWNNVCMANILQAIVQFTHGVSRHESIALSRNKFTKIRIGVTLLNNIVIPCAVVGVIAPACFYNLFVSPNSVASSYSYLTCNYISPTAGKCLTFVLESGPSYDPPFTYSYQCSSSLITYYSPAFVIVCICNSFLTPLYHMVVVQMHKYSRTDTCDGYWRWSLGCMLPAILKVHPSREPDYADEADSKTTENKVRTGRWLDGNQLVITLLGNLGLLLTFGAVFPPLAVAFAVTLTSVNLCAKLRTGRFINIAETAGHLELVRELERELQDRQTSEQLWHGLWMILTVCCLFYTFFLFDILGDAVGFDGAYWVLIVFPLLPIVFYCCVIVLRNWNSDRSHLARRTMHSSSVGMEMTIDSEEAQGETYNIMRSK